MAKWITVLWKRKIYDMKKNKSFIVIITTIVAVATFLFGDNIWGQLLNKKEDVNDLLKTAEEAFLCEDYLTALKIYQDDSLSYNTIALNNLGYLISNGLGAGKDVISGRVYYDQAAKLGSYIAFDNYLCSILLYPNTYDEVLETLEKGYNKGSTISNNFIESISMAPQIVEEYGNVTVSDFWDYPYFEQIKWLKTITHEGEIIPTDEISEIPKGDFYGELYSWKEKELIGYRTKTELDGQTTKEGVYGLVTKLGYKTYYLDYTSGMDGEQKFIFLEDDL